MRGDRQKSKRDAFLGTGIIFAVVLFFSSIFFWGHIEFFGFDPQAENMRLLQSTLIQLSGTAGFFGIFHSYVTRIDFEYEVTRALTTLLGNEPENFDYFSERVKKQFVESSIISALRPKLGKAVFDSIVSPYFAEAGDRKKNYRENMKYGVDFYDPGQSELDTWANFFGESRDFFIDRYYYCKHHLEYTKVPASPLHTVKVAIGFDEQTMQNFLRRDDVFYRDLIRLDDTLARSLAARCVTPEKLEYFVRNVLFFDIEGTRFSWRDVEMALVSQDDNDVPYLEMNIFCHRPHDPTFCIKHISIQDKKANMFLMTVPEPCESPTLWLGANAKMGNVVPRPLFSTVDPKAIRVITEQYDVNASHGTVVRHFVHVDGWSFPLGGVVFVWRNE